LLGKKGGPKGNTKMGTGIMYQKKEKKKQTGGGKGGEISRRQGKGGKRGQDQTTGGLGGNTYNGKGRGRGGGVKPPTLGLTKRRLQGRALLSKRGKNKTKCPSAK